jgi:hypothetical protein
VACTESLPGINGEMESQAASSPAFPSWRGYICPEQTSGRGRTRRPGIFWSPTQILTAWDGLQTHLAHGMADSECLRSSQSTCLSLVRDMRLVCAALPDIFLNLDAVCRTPCCLGPRRSSLYTMRKPPTCARSWQGHSLQPGRKSPSRNTLLMENSGHARIMCSSPTVPKQSLVMVCKERQPHMQTFSMRLVHVHYLRPLLQPMHYPVKCPALWHEGAYEIVAEVCRYIRRIVT